jgi:hypothetical protein
MLNESGTGPLELPSNSLSIADIVGRASRLMRMNYKLGLRILLFPVGLYYIFAEVLFGIVQYTWLPQGDLQLRIVTGVAGTLICIGVVFLMRVGTVTLWLLMSGKETDPAKAWNRAMHPRLLLLLFPTIVVELIGIFLMTFYMIALKDISEQSGDPSAAIATLTLYLVFLLIWALPMRAFELFNSLVVYNVLITKGSFKAGFKKVWSDFLARPFLLIFALTFLCLIANLIEVTSLMATIVDGVLRLFLKMNATILNWIVFVPRLFFEVLTGLMTSWICAVSILLLDNEMSIRLDGSDILTSVEKLEGRS